MCVCVCVNNKVPLYSTGNYKHKAEKYNYA